MDYTLKIGGAAGQGIQTIGDTLAKIFSRSGYYVFTHQDYESRIRGGHNFYQIRFSDSPIMASVEKIDLLIGLDKESISLHQNELTDHGLFIYDSAFLKQKGEGERFFDIPFESLAVEHGGKKVMANTVAVGAILGMLGMGLDILFDLLKAAFAKKGEEVINGNISAANAGYDYAVRECRRCSFSVPSVSSPKLLISGVEAIALGAMASGCKFYSAYPMTPSTGIMNFIAARANEYGIVVEQAEDEIAAINMAIGASFAGVRAMTGTAGGGFALMVEGLSLAAMTETPIVIALGQRPAPATGFPTRTEQGDLLFALHAGHGEFPRVIFAPGTPEQAFHLTVKAFELAEKFQVTSFVVFDTYLGDSTWTFENLRTEDIIYTDYRLRGDVFSKLQEYKRHAFSESGVSPLAVPGDGPHVVVTDSDEHDEEGHIVEDAETRIKMVDKRFLKKLPLIRREIAPPLFYGSNEPEILLTCWGSTYGVLKEAVDHISETRKIALIHFSELFPFPDPEKSDYLNLLNKATIAICIENNATGQFARLFRAETGFEFSTNIRKFDGRPFLREELIGEINGHIGRL
jgi:2-oxoglutarate/2-oxoacid ferredoxin oxidoreductase subunit alpha